MNIEAFIVDEPALFGGFLESTKFMLQFVAIKYFPQRKVYVLREPVTARFRKTHDRLLPEHVFTFWTFYRACSSKI